MNVVGHSVSPPCQIVIFIDVPTECKRLGIIPELAEMLVQWRDVRHSLIAHRHIGIDFDIGQGISIELNQNSIFSGGGFQGCT